MEVQTECEFNNLLRQCLNGGRPCPPADLVDQGMDDQELSTLLREIASCSIPENPTVAELRHFQSLLLRHAKSLAERLKLHSGLCSLALTDDLTGLYNHRGFLVLGMQLLKLALRDRQNVLLFFADVNHLKAVNDKYGHAAGDICLMRCANVLNLTFRRSDVIARYGGDEFVVLALETQDCSQEAILHRLEGIIKRSNAESTLFELSLSVGAARFDHQNPVSLAQMLMEADSLMYANKQTEF